MQNHIALDLQTTNAYQLFWYFAAERQNVFFNQLQHQKILTEDKIFKKYRFTNAYRASDRTTQYLIKNVIYTPTDYVDEDILFRILLFKIFNKIETWEYLHNALGEITWQTFDLIKYDRLLTQYKLENKTVYSNAYIMPSPSKFKKAYKHSNHLLLLEAMMNDDLTGIIKEADSLQHVFESLKSYPSIGNFLAYQYAIDINYSELIDFSENDFIVAGPGALDGISKCFVNSDKYTAEEIITIMTKIQDQEFKRFGYDFQSLWGRKLHLIDCQNIFCEVSKYTRVALPGILGISKRKKIKQIYRSSKSFYTQFYPPKWRINNQVCTSNKFLTKTI